MKRGLGANACLCLSALVSVFFHQRVKEKRKVVGGRETPTEKINDTDKK